MTSTDVAQAVGNLRYDLDTEYQVAEVTRSLTETASELVLRHPLRAYDAVQLAAAQQIHVALSQEKATPLIFVSADVKLSQPPKLKVFWLKIQIFTPTID